MRINLSARTRAFTVLGNEVLRDRRLSFTARGILAYLLSLPDGAREDVRTLADKNPGLGRRGVAKALDELIALGYYVRRTVRDKTSGQVRTETYAFDTPQPTGAPLPVPVGTGDAAGGTTGTFPKGKKNRGEEPTHPRTTKTSTAPTAGRPAPPGQTQPAPTPAPEALARGAALLSRVIRVEPKLTLSAAEAYALAPLAARWVEVGVAELEARSLLTSGLPPVIHSPRALLADRLVRKLPAPRTPHDPAAPAPGLPECGKCCAPLPRGQHTNLCATCTHTPPAPKQPTPTPTPAPEGIAERIAAVRTLVRARPYATTARA